LEKLSLPPLILPAPLGLQPLVALIDMDSSVGDLLAGKGLAVVESTVGRRFDVPAAKSFLPLAFPTFDVDLKEADIVIADLNPHDLEKPPKKNSDKASDVDQYWTSTENGLIDPRPFNLQFIVRDMNRILENDGVFVLFVGPRTTHEYQLGHIQYSELQCDGKPLSATTWGILSLLADGARVSVANDCGKQMAVDATSPLGKLLQKHIGGAEFACTFEAGYNLHQDNWCSLAKNKFGATVAAQISLGDAIVLLLPDLQDKARFIDSLVTEYLPEVRPDLFPEAAGKKWVHEAPYEFPEVLALELEIVAVHEKALQSANKLTQSIETLRAAKSGSYGLLTTTGDELVGCVLEALRFLGFKNVVNADEIAKEAGASNLAEDIQILDSDPLLLAEVKGIGGMPADDDILSASKYLAVRMREWKKTNLKALSIINHQRNLPALTRDDNLIRAEILPTIEQQEIGVITTLDLFRLVRGKEQCGWDDKHIRPLFLQSGRIRPIPLHYEYVGKVTKFKDDICGIAVEAVQVRATDTIAFELDLNFVELKADGLQIDNKVVEIAEVGQTFGIRTKLSKAELMGSSVFRVID
jgi:hypothetical protein